MHVLGYCSMFGSCTLISVIICGGRPYDSPQVSKWGVVIGQLTSLPHGRLSCQIW